MNLHSPCNNLEGKWNHVMWSLAKAEGVSEQCHHTWADHFPASSSFSEEPQEAPVCSLLLHKQTFLPVSKTQKLSIGWEPSSFQQATDMRLPHKSSLHQETQLTPTAQGNSANTTNLNHHQGEHLSSPHQDVSRIFSSHYLKWRLWLQILLVTRVLTLPPTCIQCEHCTAAPWEMQPAENHLCTSTSAAETTAECS